MILSFLHTTPMMILGQISYLDCLAFLAFLIPQLLVNVNIFELAFVGISCIPFLLVALPYHFIHERYLTSRLQRSPFVQWASPFQDVVIRCVRYAFAHLPASIGQVFFSRSVALPFLRWRMLRHSYRSSPIRWKEVDDIGVKGLWITPNERMEPDLIILYLHGGGFSMGSSYFYLEFLLALTTLLKPHYRNPTIFALDYTLVPHASHPTQLHQILNAYYWLLPRISYRASRVCLAGDSAGATLILSLLLYLAESSTGPPAPQDLRPGYATLISPWVTLVSDENRDTRSDYLNANSLHLYGSQYAGRMENLQNPVVSPGRCKDLRLWKRAAPIGGLYVAYGSEEVFGPEIRDWVRLLREAGVKVVSREEPAGIHAWVVARVFLGERREERIKGLADIVAAIRAVIPPIERTIEEEGRRKVEWGVGDGDDYEDDGTETEWDP